MKNSKDLNPFFRYTIMILYLLFQLVITQNIFPQQKDVYSQAPVVFENNIRKSTQLNVKFNVKVFEFAQNKITAGYNEMLPGKGILKPFFQELEKKYGEFTFTKIIPRAKWADTFFMIKLQVKPGA